MASQTGLRQPRRIRRCVPQRLAPLRGDRSGSDRGTSLIASAATRDIQMSNAVPDREGAAA
jgi:hypothetical protein